MIEHIDTIIKNAKTKNDLIIQKNKYDEIFDNAIKVIEFKERQQVKIGDVVEFINTGPVIVLAIN